MAHNISTPSTLCQVLEQTASRFGLRPALADIGAVPVTYAEMYDAVMALGEQLTALGVGLGDRVAIVSENNAHWGISYFAISCIGAVVVPILSEFHPDAIAHIIRQSSCKGIIVSEKLLGKLDDAHFEGSPFLIDIASFTIIEQGVTKDRLEELKTVGLREFRKLKEKAMRLAHREVPAVSEDDLAVIIYTSGSTGHSKGVMLTHKNVISNALAVLGVEEVTEHDRFFSILPLPHAYECTVGLVLPLLVGASVHYLDKPPTARVLQPAMGKVRPTAMLTVPLVLEKIYKNSIYPKLYTNRFLRFLCTIGFTRRIIARKAGKKLLDFFGGCLRVVVVGGAPMAADAERFLYEAHFPYVIGYGLTETAPLVCASPIKAPRLFSAGPSVKGVTVRIHEPDATGSGEILVRGPNVMQGYFLDPKLTAEAFTEDGWFRTGDLGSLSRDGYLTIRGRSKNVILGPSGENIYPEEIESFFFEFSLVSEVLVYMYEGKLTAWVHLDAAAVDDQFGSFAPSEREKRVLDFLEEARLKVNEKVSSFSRIHRIVEQPEPFEKTATKKIKRYLYVTQ